MNEIQNADWVQTVIRFTTDTVEVIRLKLRIIGFSNKLTGLYARLGEAAFGAVECDAPFTENEIAQRLMADIREAQREIKAAEEGIEAIRALRNEGAAPEKTEPPEQRNE